jgi:hypothetical protein
MGLRLFGLDFMARSSSGPIFYVCCINFVGFLWTDASIPIKDKKGTWICSIITRVFLCL